MMPDHEQMEFDAWSTIVVRHGTTDPLDVFGYGIGDPVPGCPRLRATKMQTNLREPRSFCGCRVRPSALGWYIPPAAPASFQEALADGSRQRYAVTQTDVIQIAEQAKVTLHLGSTLVIQIDLHATEMRINPTVIDSLGPIESFHLRVRWRNAIRLGLHPAGGGRLHGVVPIIFRLHGRIAT